MRSLAALAASAGALWALVVIPTTAGPGLRGAADLAAPTAAPPPPVAPPALPPPPPAGAAGAQADLWPGYADGPLSVWHTGAFDFVAPEGTPVYAPASGTLATVGSYTDPLRYGAYVMIVTPHDLEIYVGHLNPEDVNPLALPIGGWVAAGTPIGTLSEFPYSTPHAHVQLRRGGQLVGEADWWLVWSMR